MKLSVIIPVYNVEDYIKKCVVSLQQQDLAQEEYELIIINDGSTDNSRLVVFELMRSFTNIVFIEQENKGVSKARDAGIDKARGKYLLFIDPDDYVETNSFARMLTTANQQQAEIVFLGYQFRNADNTVRKEIYYTAFQGKSYTGIDAYSISRGDGYTDPDRSVAILYERKFINQYQLRYIPDVPYLEDGEFLARVLCLAGSCIFEGNPFYIRTTRLGSATNSRMFFSDKAANGFIIAAENLFNFQQKEELTINQKEFLNQPVCKFILLAVNASFKNNGAFKFKAVVEMLQEKGLRKCALKGCISVYKKEGYIYNLSPRLYAIYKFAWSVKESAKRKLLRQLSITTIVSRCKSSFFRTALNKSNKA